MVTNLVKLDELPGVMSESHTFGYWLRTKRKGLDLTRERLAEQVGCSAALIRKLEAEERRASEHIVACLANIFSIPESERGQFLRFARGDWKSAPAESAEAAPWRTSSLSIRTNLPASLTSLIGRDRDLAEILGYLANPTIRIVTLTGPLGIGKTRLGVEVAHQANQMFPGGVFFIALELLEDPRLIAPAIVQALGYSEVKNKSSSQRLIEGIGDQHLLLLLDNVEHLIQAVTSLVTDLLSACPRLHILITSRESLRIPGEWIYPVHALSAPTETKSLVFDSSLEKQYPALALFSERARAVQPDFVLIPDNLDVIAAICNRIDGLPLAIELITPRLRLMSPQSLLEHLNGQSLLTVESMRSLPARQSTLLNAICWSYELLTESEKDIFRYLSVFRGGFNLVMAEELAQRLAFEGVVIHLAASLVDKSLLNRSVDSTGESRFHMLSAIHQFASDQLREWGREMETRNQHLTYFLELAEKADREIRGPEQVQWMDRIEIELENFRAALEWCVSNQNTEQALQLLNALDWPWWLRGRSTEIRDWFEKIRKMPDSPDQRVAFVSLLNQMGRQSWLSGNIEDARSVLEESCSLSLQIGEQGERIRAEALAILGMVSFFNEIDRQGANSLIEHGLAIYQKSGDKWGIALTTFMLGIVGDDLALSRLQLSLNLFEQLGDLWGIGRVSQNLGQLYLKMGDYLQAQRYFEQHLEIDTKLRFSLGTAIALGNLGELFCRLGDYVQAENFLMKSVDQCHQFGLKNDAAFYLIRLGIVALYQNDYPRSRKRFMDALKVIWANKDDPALSYIFYGLAANLAGTNDPEQAARLSGVAQKHLEKTQGKLEPLDQAEFERHLTLSRQQLGHAAFTAFMEEGQCLEIGAVAAEVLK
jgi:predicted ATPase/transcriptional regulator with XRE-family HTH domain